MLKRSIILFLFIPFFLFSCEKKIKNTPVELNSFDQPTNLNESSYLNSSKKLSDSFSLNKIKKGQINDDSLNKHIIYQNKNVRKNIQKDVQSQIEKLFAIDCDINSDKKKDFLVFYRIIHKLDTTIAFSCYLNHQEVLYNIFEDQLPLNTKMVDDVLFYSDSTFIIRYYNFDSEKIQQTSYKLVDNSKIIKLY
jgi:hypothetical protein